MANGTVKDGYPRHRFFYALFRPPVRLFTRLFFGYRVKQVQRLPGPSFVLCNHNSPYDMLFIGSTIRDQMYYVAGDNVFRMGLVSRLMQWIFAPICRVKGSTDASSAMTILRTLKKGRNVCMFPAGNCSYNGLPWPIHPTLGRMAKKTGVNLVTFRTSGVYFFGPRWSHTTRRGPMSGEIVHVYTPEDLKQMTAEEVYDAIVQDLYEDSYAEQERKRYRYKGKKRAEWLETALCLCPRCGRLDTLRSEGNVFTCHACGLRVEYGEDGFFHGPELPFRNVRDWDSWQAGKLDELAEKAGDEPVFSDEDMKLFAIDGDLNMTLADTGTLSLSRSALQLGNTVFPLPELTKLDMALQCRILIARDGVNYEIRRDTPWNARKYAHLFQYWKAHPAEEPVTE